MPYKIRDYKIVSQLTNERVQVSSRQVTDKLWFVKGVNGKMSKHTSKQTGNIDTTPIVKWERI